MDGLIIGMLAANIALQFYFYLCLRGWIDSIGEMMGDFIHKENQERGAE